jgi:hypothetical protein
LKGLLLLLLCSGTTASFFLCKNCCKICRIDWPWPICL